MQDETEITQKIQALCDSGYNPDVAEALAENGITPETAEHLSKREVLEHYLNWNGIIGFTESILLVLQNAEDNCNM